MIDDSKSERFVLRRYLEGHRYRVETVETLDEARRYLESKRPGVIFLDHPMPGVEGFGALRELRQNAPTAGVAVVLCVGDQTADFESQARSAGASAVLPKPPAPEQLRRILDELERDGRRPDLEVPFVSPNPTLGPGAQYGSPLGTRAARVSPSLAPIVPVAQPALTPPVSPPTSVVLADSIPATALSPSPDDAIREQLESRMRRVSQGLVVQFAEIKATVAQLASQQAKLAEIPSSVRTELHAGLDETHQALRLVTSRIEGIEREVFSQLTEMRTHLDSSLKDYGERVADLVQHARQAAAEEAQIVAERTVMSAALRISDQLADAILGAAKR
ncbi:MAG: response regulator [Panacagrimonas sp.]